jgi:hypothetical protein
MSRKVLVGLAFGALVVIGGTAIWLKGRQPPRPAETVANRSVQPDPAVPIAPGRSNPLQRQLYEDIRRDGLTPERAKQLFSLAIGPLPGTTVPADGRDQTDFCGTLAVSYINQVWGSLNAAEQSAVRSLLGSAQAPRSTHNLPAILLDGLTAPQLRLVSYRPDIPGPETGLFDYKGFAAAADAKIGGMFGTTPLPFTLDVGQDIAQDKPGTKAFTWLWYEGTNTPLPGGCHIHVYEPVVVANGYDAVDIKSLMSHEMFHCYEETAAVTSNAYRSIHEWITEGEADWVMAELVPTAKIFQRDWDSYGTSPKTPYYNLGQTAIGVFGHLEDVTKDPHVVWLKLLPLLQAGLGGNDDLPFNLLVAGNRQAYLTSWGASFFVDNTHDNWKMAAPGHGPDKKPSPQALSIAPDEFKVFDPMTPYTTQQYEITSSADLIAFSMLHGWGRVHDSGFNVDAQLNDGDTVVLCMRDDKCTCPDGSPGSSLDFQTAKQPISVGLEAGSDFSIGGAAAKKLDLTCKKIDPPPLVQQGGGGGGGGGGNPPEDPPKRDPGTTSGDTHIETFDGIRYDFQVVGEYTLVKSTADDFAVQVRQVPWGHSRTVTVNQAVATRLGRQRVSVTNDSDLLTLRIDGQPNPDAQVKLAGGTITRNTTMFGPVIRLEWLDGTTARIERIAGGLGIKVSPAAARRGALIGLLGNDNGTPADDLIASGHELGTNPPPDVITKTFADAWRVPDGASLFDYAAGQSAATFVDPGFPEALVDPNKVPNREAAEARCRETGVTDRRLLDDCIVDYGMTNDFLFAAIYGRTQQMMAANATLPQRAAGVIRTEHMNGTNTASSPLPQRYFNGRAGDIVWIGQPDCNDDGLAASVRAADGKPIPGTGGALCVLGRLMLPSDSEYVIQTRGGNRGSYQVPIRFVRPDRVQATSYGGIVAGLIETPGAHDVYTFDGHEGDLLRFSGEGCYLGSLVVSIVDGDGHDSLGPSCRSGSDAKLRNKGPYKLVINGGDSGSGAYHFLIQGVATESGK